VSSLIQKYIWPLGSSNLRDDAQYHSTELLAAAALCRDLGTKLFHLKFAGDATTSPSLLEIWRETVIMKAQHRCWPADMSSAKIGRPSLHHWLNDVGADCTGRAYEPVKGVASSLSDVECRTCVGVSRRPVVATHSIEQLVDDMVDSPDAMAAHARGRTMKRLACESILSWRAELNCPPRAEYQNTDNICFNSMMKARHVVRTSHTERTKKCLVRWRF
jgi:hypothetical protein